MRGTSSDFRPRSFDKFSSIEWINTASRLDSSVSGWLFMLHPRLKRPESQLFPSRDVPHQNRERPGIISELIGVIRRCLEPLPSGCECLFRVQSRWDFHNEAFKLPNWADTAPHGSLVGGFAVQTD